VDDVGERLPWLHHLVEALPLEPVDDIVHQLGRDDVREQLAGHFRHVPTDQRPVHVEGDVLRLEVDHQGCLLSGSTASCSVGVRWSDQQHSRKHQVLERRV
jgi:hypothetical protein